jgi:hypothetical protein
MIIVINGFKEGFESFDNNIIVYIGRGGKGLPQSPLANPFKLKPRFNVTNVTFSLIS